jgi:tetratricopeptide (TPR) repeat protein
MITIRLNLSMAMQKPELADWDSAVEQARLALQELKPFTITPGHALSGKVTGSEEAQVPETAYYEAKELQGKAYFRLGTAQYSAKNYSGAVSSYEKSLQSMKHAKPEVKPDAMVLRRLAEARRDKAKKQERLRKKFKNSIHDDDK